MSTGRASQRNDVIRPVDYQAGSVSAGIEVFSIADLRRRGGPEEFRSPQRLGFDLLLFISTGEATHSVDFTGYPLHPGDVLWVRSGQVQRWGNLGSIDGRVVLFTPEVLDADLSRKSRIAPRRVHWEGVYQHSGDLSHALADLHRVTQRLSLPDELFAPLLKHSLARVILELFAAEDIVSLAAPVDADEAYQWFVDEIEQRYRDLRRVGDYAKRLGYSTKTLNRLSQRNAGLTAKELIDQRLVLEAKRYLAHGGSSIGEIAQKLGFTDPASFTKYFTGHTGTSPSTFRSAVR